MKKYSYILFFLLFIWMAQGQSQNGIIECNWDPTSPDLFPSSSIQTLPTCTNIIDFDDYDHIAPITIYIVYTGDLVPLKTAQAMPRLVESIFYPQS